tara:strand:+ start:9 stop:134 length:126 start_codon:yes stop_codon:yes gene_type:complete
LLQVEHQVVEKLVVVEERVDIVLPCQANLLVGEHLLNLQYL